MVFFSKKKVIYYPGTTLTKFFPEIVQNYKTILADLGILVEIDESFNSGWALWDQGYQKEYREHKKYLKNYFSQQNIREIITSSPEAAYILKRDHPELRVRHTTEVIYQHVQKIQSFNSGNAVFHDNTTQVRRNNILQEPRAILQRAGFTLLEFLENKKQTQCLGTSTGLINNSPRLAAKLAMRRAKLAPTKIIITDSPEDYIHLKRNTNLTILELSEVLVEI